MFLRTVAVKGKAGTYRYAQLVESYRRRKDRRPAHRVLANLGRLSDDQLAILRQAFAALGTDGAPVLPEAASVPAASLSIAQNLQYLDVAVAYEAWLRSGVGRVLGELVPAGHSEMPFADVVAALTSHRCVAPGSKLAAARWFPDTAWPELLGRPPGRFGNTRVHRTLESLDPITDELQRRLPDLYVANQARFAALFLDVTDTWFVGRGPPVAEQAYTKEGFYEYAIGIVLLCNEHGEPLRWEVVSARDNDVTTMRAMLERVSDLDFVREVPLVMDRAMGTTATLEKLTGIGLRFVTALTTTEFDPYTDGHIHWQGLTDIDARVPEARVQAAKAVEGAGMRRVSDTLYVSDLGVVERKEDPGDKYPPSLYGENHVQEALKLAKGMQAEIAAGRVRDYCAAARAVHLPTQRMSDYRLLLELVPDLQDEVLAGHAKMPLQALAKVARQPDAEKQRALFAEENLKKHPARRRPRMAVYERPPAQPLRLRVVVCFNPRLFIDHRKGADDVLGKIRAFERRVNERLRSPHSHSTRNSVYAQADQELRHHHLLDAFEIRIEEQGGRAVSVELRLIPEAWRARRRFDGFSVVVAHPDSPQDAAALVSLYRAKDCVEKDFRHIKSEIELRPLWHHTDAKVRAHVTLCILALLVDRLLERKLREAGRPMTAKALYELLGTVHLNRCRVKGSDKAVYILTDATPDQKQALAALGMEHLVDGPAVAARIAPR
jgi:hypothetical protein